MKIVLRKKLKYVDESKYTYAKTNEKVVVLYISKVPIFACPACLRVRLHYGSAICPYCKNELHWEGIRAEDGYEYEYETV